MKNLMILLTLITTPLLASEPNKEGWTQVYDFAYTEGMRWGRGEHQSMNTVSMFLAAGTAIAEPIAGISSTALAHCNALYRKADETKDDNAQQLSDVQVFFEFMTSCLVKTPTIPFIAVGDMVSTIYDNGSTAGVRDFSTDATKGTSSGLDGYSDILAATQQESLEQLVAVIEGMDEEMPLATALIDSYIENLNQNATREEAALAIIENV